MRRPPRPPTQRLVSARRLIVTLLQGLTMFVPVAVVDYAARSLGWPLAQVRALDFTALVAGNLALIVLYRPGRTLRDAIASRNVPFLIAGGATLAMLTLGTRSEAAGAWLNFVPPPWPAWVASLAAPFLLAIGLRSFMGHVGDTADPKHPR